MKAPLARLAIDKPRTVFAAVAVLTAVAAALISSIRIDTDPENMLPAAQPDRVFHNHVEKIFTLHDAIVVGIVNESHPDGIYNARSLAALHALTGAVLALDGVMGPDLMSLAVSDNIGQAGPGTIRFEWMMRDAPVSAQQAADIRQKVERLPLLKDTLVSGDGKAAAIYVPIESKDLSYRLAREIRALTLGLDSDDSYHITGLPVAEDTFGHDMFVQMGISAPLAGLTIFLVMLWFFRSAPLVVAPMLVAMATVVITMGALIGLGFTVHIMSSMIPIFLMPIAVVDSVHIMSEFADNYRPGVDVKATIRRVVDHLFTPMLFTSLTSAIGFASLLLTPIPPVQVFGAFVAVGILLAFLLTILMIPAWVVRMRPATIEKLATRTRGSHSDTALARSLRRAGGFAVRYGKPIAAVAVVLVAVSLAGINRIQINDNPVRWFKANHEIRVADAVLNAHFAGTYDAFVVLSHDAAPALEAFRSEAAGLLDDVDVEIAAAIRGRLEETDESTGAWLGNVIAAVDDAMFQADGLENTVALEHLQALAEKTQVETGFFKQPRVLAEIEAIQRALEASGLVGKTNALPDVVKVVNRELRGGLPVEYRLPATGPAVAQALLQFQSSHRPQDLWHMVTPDYSSTAIWLQLKSGDNQDMTRVIEALDQYLTDHPLPAGVELDWAGKTYINVVWQNAMVNGMLTSLLGAFVVVFAMMALLFRSLRLGLLAMVPLSVTIIGVYGIIGWVGKDYDMPIAVLSALTLGLSVDFAIHFIERTRALIRADGLSRALVGVFEEPARAISRNAIVIAIGFTPLFFAPLVPYITVGAFMAAIMALSGVATLVLLPAILSFAGSWFFPEAKRTAGMAVESAEAAGA